MLLPTRITLAAAQLCVILHDKNWVTIHVQRAVVDARKPPCHTVRHDMRATQYALQKQKKHNDKKRHMTFRNYRMNTVTTTVSGTALSSLLLSSIHYSC